MLAAARRLAHLGVLLGAAALAPGAAAQPDLARAFAEAPGDDHEVVVLAEARHAFLIPTPDGAPRFAQGFWTRMGEWLADRGIARPACAAD